MTFRYVHDINRLRRRLRGLSSTALLRALQEQLDTIPVAAIAADNTGRHVAANARAAALTGYSQAELLQMDMDDIGPRQPRFGDLWNRFIQTGSQNVDYILWRKDGVPVGVHCAGFASVAPGVHVSFLTPVEIPSSI